MIGFVAADGAMRPLGKCLLSDRIKQRAIHDGRLPARQDLILVFDLADIEVVAQQVVQRATTERDATARRARRELPCFGSDVVFPEVPNQFVDAAEFQVSLEDRSDQLSFYFDNRNLAVLHLIAKGKVAPDPEALALRRRDLVSDPLGGDLTLE